MMDAAEAIEEPDLINDRKTMWSAEWPAMFYGEVEGLPEGKKVVVSSRDCKAYSSHGVAQGKPANDFAEGEEETLQENSDEAAAEVPFSEDLETNLDELMREFEIPDDKREIARAEVFSCLVEFRKRVLAEGLSDKTPIKEYEPRTGIIAYLKAADGFGPWHDAGLLTQPLIRRHSKRAYNALHNWLRNPSNRLEDHGLVIPTRQELVKADLANEEKMREVSRLRSAQRRARDREEPALDT